MRRVDWFPIGIAFAVWATFFAIIFVERWQASQRAGFDEARLARIDAHYQAAFDNGEMPGARAVIYQGGETVYERNWGFQDIASKTPIKADTIFHIYSMTKPITSVAVMMLFEEGKFLLHEPIAKYIPELADLRVYDAENGTGNPPTRRAVRQPTIHDVLTHSAGFTYGLFDLSPVGDMYRQDGFELSAAIDLQQFVARLGKLPLRYDPGTKWNYSVSTDVLGRLVEVASGMSLGAFLKTRLFDPLGMKDTGFTYQADSRDRVATLYSPEGIPGQFAEKGFLSQPSGPGLEPAHKGLLTPYHPDALLQSGGGGLISTTDDYLRFARMLLNGGALDDVRILSPISVNMMRHDALGDIKSGQRLTSIMPKQGIGFGLGFGVITDQSQSGLIMPAQSYFWGGAAGTIFWIDPQNDLIALFMTQIVPHRTTLRQDMWPLTYQAMTKLPKKRKDAHR